MSKTRASASIHHWFQTPRKSWKHGAVQVQFKSFWKTFTTILWEKWCICMVCLLIILSEPLGLLSLENCFLRQWKLWRKRDQKGSDWTRGQHVRMENFKVSPLCRTSSTMPDAGKSKLILVCFENHKTVITMGNKIKNLRLCEKTLPSNCCILSTLFLMTIFWSTLGSSRRPPTALAILWPKKHSFPPMVFKIQLCLEWEGRGGVVSFTNITGKVPTLVTSNFSMVGM